MYLHDNPGREYKSNIIKKQNLGSPMMYKYIFFPFCDEKDPTTRDALINHVK